MEKFINNIIEGETLKELKKIPNNSIDMLLADLPYGTTQNKWDSIIPLNKLWKEYRRIVKKMERDKGIRKNQRSGSYGDFKPIQVKSEGPRYPVDIVYFKSAESEGKVIHPTQKPVELGRYLIRTYSAEGDIILDNTSGSGSFLVAAIMEGRNFIGIERENKYNQEALQRIQKAYKNLKKEKKKTILVKNIIETIKR
jgi:DNA (cytosine-5-)-methyltransferase